MCIIVFNWQPGTAQPLLLVANRDEMHARRTQPLAQWPDQPRVHAGRDLEAGGSWLGIAPQGRFAALTNIRDLVPLKTRSRGELVGRYLAGDSTPAAYIQQVAQQAAAFSGFNLLVGDAQHLWFLHSKQPQPLALAPGLYALCNANLDTPWPKLVRLRTLFSRLQRPTDTQLLQLMQDTWRPPDLSLPDTQVGLVLERMLSSIFIHGEAYGTRATSVLRMSEAQLQLAEYSYTAAGQLAEQTEVRLPL